MFIRDHKTATIGEEILPLEMGFLPEFFRKKGEELNYTPQLRERSLRKLKETMGIDDTFNNMQFTDELLLVFLNSRKYDLNKTVLQIKKYLQFKNSAPYMFMNVSFEELLPCVTSKLLRPLPWRCQDGCAIGVLNLGQWNPEIHSIESLKRMYFTLITQTLIDPMTQVNGIKAIIDLNVNPNILRVATPSTMYQIYSGTEKMLPARVKGYHLVNIGTLGKALWHVMKMCLSEKVKQRVHVHKSIDTLQDYFPKSVLPLEYGGDLKDCDMTQWLRKVTSPEEMKILNIMSN